MLDVYESIIRNEMITSCNDSLDLLYTYLFNVEIWGYYELRLYNSTMFLMSPEMVLILSKNAHVLGGLKK